MRTWKLRLGERFRVAFEVRRVQCAQMVLAPGEHEGDRESRHRGADQWRYVIDGWAVGLGETGGRRRCVALEPGRLLVIDKGERHEVRSTGDALLRTLNFYHPPAFEHDGDPKGGRAR